MRFSKALVIIICFQFSAAAEQLKPATLAAFNQYVSEAERRMTNEVNAAGFLWIDAAPVAQRNDFYARLHKGEVLTKQLQTFQEGRAIDVPDALIHHWVGLVFIPGASLASTMGLLQDYDHHYKFYAPDVQRSRLVRRNGNDFHVYLQLRRKKVITVVLNTEYDVHYTMLGSDRALARSYSTRIAELQNASKSEEIEKPVGDDDGFLWRLNSYWRLWQRDGGTYVELEAISLTRDIPAGLGWLIRPFVTSVPRESLEFTLARTRAILSMKTTANAWPGKFRPGDVRAEAPACGLLGPSCASADCAVTPCPSAQMPAAQGHGVADLSLKGACYCIGSAFAARYPADIRRIAADFLGYPVVDATVECRQTV